MRQLLLLLGIIMSCHKVTAQDSSCIIKITTKSIESISNKADAYNNKIDKQTIKYIRKIERQEAKIKRKLQQLDSSVAKEMFDNAKEQFTSLKNKVENKVDRLKQHKIAQYIPSLDSITTGLQFLKNNAALSSIKNASEKLDAGIGKYKELQNKLEVTKNISQYIKERQAMLKEVMAKYGLSKKLKKYNKVAYYYTEQINEYKAALKDPIKAEKLILATLQKIPKFKEFVAGNNLTSMFPSAVLPMQNNTMGNSYQIGTVTTYNGLQSRILMQQTVQNRFRGSNMVSANNFNTNVKNALRDYNELKQELENEKVKKTKGFKPNKTKTKSIKERVYFMFDIQFDKKTNYFPTASNIGLQSGFKVNDNANIGVGVSYKLGFGSDWKNIKITSEDLGLRSFIEYKAVQHLYARIGAELNYKIKQYTYGNIVTNQNWERSFLAGCSKKINLRGKKASIELLYDFLYKEKLVQQNPLIYRISYNF